MARSGTANSLTTMAGAPRPPERPADPTALVGRSTFVGREREIGELLAVLADARLVTVTGTGGCGKTRLALEVAARHGGEVAVVELAAVRDPTLVPASIAAAVGVPSGSDPPLDRLVRVIGGRPMLLVLDNLEQLLGSGPSITRLLGACPGLTVLATSRVPLELSAERRFPLAPLPLPLADAPLDTLATQPVVSLLAERARAVDPRFAVTDANARVLAAICRRLDGLPLAIELAAARLRLLSPSALLDRLDHPLAVLKGGPIDGPDRQRTVRDTIAWSVALLPPPAATLLTRLGVFAGGFDLAAAQAVAAPGIAGSEEELLDLLALLVDHNLLLVSVGADGGPRFSMLETIREWAIEHLEDERATRDRHLACYLAFADAADGEWEHAGHADAARRVAAEIDNLRAGLAWAEAREDAGALLHLAACLFAFWRFHGEVHEGIDWLGRAIASAGDRRDVWLVRALNDHATLTSFLGDGAAMERGYGRALALARDLGDDAGISYALRGLSNAVVDYHGDLARADDLLLEALVHARAAADASGEARVQLSLGIDALLRGELDGADRRFEEALGVARAAGNRLVEGRVIAGIGDVRLEADDPAAAVAAYTASAEVLAAIGDRGFLAFTTAGLVVALLRLGDLGRAREEIGRLVPLALRTGSLYEPCLLDCVAEWLGLAGRSEDAVRSWGAASGARRPAILVTMPWDERYMRHRLESDRRAVGEPHATLAWEDGRRTPADRALADALAQMASTDLDARPRERIVLRGGELTPREAEVLALVGEGCADGEIAERLGITKRTASVHVANIKDKLGTANRVETALEARRLGLVHDSR